MVKKQYLLIYLEGIFQVGIVLYMLCLISCNSLDSINKNTILRYKYDEKSGKLIEIFSSKSIHEFDKNENLIQILTFNSDGLSLGKMTFKYDSNNNLIESNNYTLMTKTTFKYDSNNNLIEESFLNSVGFLMSKKIYKYDSNNNLIELILESPEDLIETLLDIIKFKYVYDSNNNLTQELQYNSDGLLMIKFLYTYDKLNNLIEKYGYDDKGLLWREIIYKYNSDNNKIQETFYNSDKNYTTDFNGVSTYKYKYNLEKKILEELGYYYRLDPGEQKEVLKSKTIYQY